jgi:ketosteroid isomerase-like protein
VTEHSNTVDLARRYFAMWNTGEADEARMLLDPGWIDHAHPEIDSVEQVRSAVERIHADRPQLRFEIETILGEGELALVVGGVGDAGRPGQIISRLIWLLRARDGRLTEIWTYRPTGPGGSAVAARAD